MTINFGSEISQVYSTVVTGKRSFLSAELLASAGKSSSGSGVSSADLKRVNELKLCLHSPYVTSFRLTPIKAIVASTKRYRLIEDWKYRNREPLDCLAH